MDQAIRLKELGVTQESVFSWFLAKDRDDIPALNRSWKSDCPTCGHPQTPYFAEVSAFTVAELGQMIGSEFYTERLGTATSQYANWDWVGAENRMGPFSTEAEARADFLIKMLEIGMYTAEEVNKRLEA